MSFSVAEEDKLIELVAGHAILYDANHPNYHNVQDKEFAWKFIAQELKKSSEICKKKWKFIRDGYQRYKRRNRLGPGFPAHKNSKDKRHAKLLFLEDPSHLKAGCSYIPDSSSVVKLEEINFLELEPQNNDKELPTNPSTKRKRVSCDSNDEKPLKYWQDRDKLQDPLKSTGKKKEDDVELFCQHIAEVLRTLPPVYKANAKKDISILISDYEIKAAEMQANTD